MGQPNRFAQTDRDRTRRTGPCLSVEEAKGREGFDRVFFDGLFVREVWEVWDRLVFLPSGGGATLSSYTSIPGDI